MEQSTAWNTATLGIVWVHAPADRPGFAMARCGPSDDLRDPEAPCHARLAGRGEDLGVTGVAVGVDEVLG